MFTDGRMRHLRVTPPCHLRQLPGKAGEAKDQNCKNSCKN